MSEEVNIGTLPTQETVGDDDYVLLWIAAGTLVRVNGKAFQSQYEAPKVGPLPINLNGIYSSAGQAASIKNDGDQGLVIAAKSGSNNSPANLVGISALYLGSGTANPLLDKTTANALYENKLQTALGVGSLKNGVPMKMSGAAWVNPAAGEEWLGIAQIAGTTVYIVSGGKVTIDGSAFVNGSASVGTPYWWNGSLWDTTKPTAWDAFTGKIVPVSSTEAIVLPFKRRSSLFRPATTQPDGAGRVNVIFNDSALPGGTLYSGGYGSRLYKSTDDGATWAAVVGTISANYDRIEDISIVGGKLYISLGSPSGTTTAKPWIYTANLDGSGMAIGSNFLTYASPTKAIRKVYSFGGFTFGLPSGNRALWRNTGPTTQLSAATLAFASGINEVYDYYVTGNANAGMNYFLANNTFVRVAVASAAWPGLSTANATFAGETSLRTLAVNGNTMLIGAGSGKVYKTTNLNAATPTWDTGTQIPKSTTVNDLVYSGTYYYAATNDGIYRTKDDPYQWAQVFGGVEITALSINGAGKVLAGDVNGKLYLEN